MMEGERQLFRLPGESPVPGWSTVSLEGKNGQPGVRIWVEAIDPKPDEAQMQIPLPSYEVESLPGEENVRILCAQSWDQYKIKNSSRPVGLLIQKALDS